MISHKKTIVQFRDFHFEVTLPGLVSIHTLCIQGEDLMEEMQQKTVRQNVASETEGKVYKTVIRPAMLYGPERWVTTKPTWKTD